MRKPIYLTLAASSMLALAACASTNGGSATSTGPVKVVQIAAYTGDQAFEAQFSDSIDYPAMYGHPGPRLNERGDAGAAAQPASPAHDDRGR